MMPGVKDSKRSRGWEVEPRLQVRSDQVSTKLKSSFSHLCGTGSSARPGTSEVNQRKTDALHARKILLVRLFVCVEEG